MSTCSKKYVIKYPPNLVVGPRGPQGPKGDPGVADLPLSSDDVDYNGTSLTDVLDQLLYDVLSILTFVASPSNYEKGQTLTSVALTWSFNKAIETQSITGVGVTPPTLLVGDRSKTVVLSNITTNTVITLTADDDTGDSNTAKTAQVSLTFLNKIHWGKAVIPGAINSAFILALTSNELSSTKSKVFQSTTGANEYIWFASPVAYGIPSFITNGFNGGFSLVATVSHTNASGHTEDYYVCRSDNHTLGLTYIEVF